MGLALMDPFGKDVRPNYWRPCMTCESNIQFAETRSERQYTYEEQHGTAAPMEIYDALRAFHAEACPVYKPMSMQPVFRGYDQITVDGSKRDHQGSYNDQFWIRCDRARQNYESGLCLPGDLRMSREEQDRIIDIVLACYGGKDIPRMASVS